MQWYLKNQPERGGEIEKRLQDPFDYAGEDRLIAVFKESMQRMAAVPFNIDTSRPIRMLTRKRRDSNGIIESGKRFDL